MQFVKMHGAGNDYIFIDCLDSPRPDSPEQLALLLSDRHRGIGSDGLILIEPDDIAAARMSMWNADGTPGEMCGNGLRCLASYLFQQGHCRETRFTVATDTPAAAARSGMVGRFIVAPSYQNASSAALDDTL